MGRRVLVVVLAGLLWIAAMPVVDVGVAAQRQAQTHEVDIVDHDFRPPDLDILVGDTVKWTNRGREVHTSTMDGVWDSDLLAPGATYSRTFDQAGTFDYHCHIHHGMEGRIQVRQPGQPLAEDDRAELTSGLPGSPASVSLNVLTNDRDLEGDQLTLIGNSQGARGGSVECSPNGDCTFTERASTCLPSDSFTYTISDGSKTDTARVIVGIVCAAEQSHRRSISLVLKKHLKAKGEVGVSDGFNRCKRGRKVVISRRAGGKWVEVAATKTSRTGAYAVSVPDRPGKYRAVATRSVLGDDICEVAKAVRRHSH